MTSTPPTDPKSPAPGTRNIPPLVWLVVAALVVIVVVALTQCHGMTRTPTSENRTVDQGAPQKATDAVMPQQSTASPTPAPASDVPWAKARDSRPNSANEEGGTETTTSNAGGPG